MAAAGAVALGVAVVLLISQRGSDRAEPPVLNVRWDTPSPGTAAVVLSSVDVVDEARAAYTCFVLQRAKGSEWVTTHQLHDPTRGGEHRPLPFNDEDRCEERVGSSQQDFVFELPPSLDEGTWRIAWLWTPAGSERRVVLGAADHHVG